VHSDKKTRFTIETRGRFNLHEKLCHFFCFYMIRNFPIEEGKFSTFSYTLSPKTCFVNFFELLNFSPKLLGRRSWQSCPLELHLEWTSNLVFLTCFFSYTLSFFWTFVRLYIIFFLLYNSDYFHFSRKLTWLPFFIILDEVYFLRGYHDPLYIIGDGTVRHSTYQQRTFDLCKPTRRHMHG
jgi:hypothetical protein